MKKCVECGEEKGAGDFYKARGNRDGLHSLCKLCYLKGCKKRYAANPQEIKDRSKKWRLDNPDRYKLMKHKYYVANFERHKEKNLAWRLANPEKKRAADREWRLKNQERKSNNDKLWRLNNIDKAKQNQRNGHVKRTHGITQEQYEVMLGNQGGVCAICGAGQPSCGHKHFAIDHCHTTGKIRALLCFHCNTAIGHFKEDAEVMQRAIRYLEYFESGGGGSGRIAFLLTQGAEAQEKTDATDGNEKVH